jgi:hypothetical protein
VILNRPNDTNRAPFEVWLAFMFLIIFAVYGFIYVLRVCIRGELF